MCIIIVKPKGVDLPSEDELKNCFDNNPDGFGLAFREKDAEDVTICKGALTFDTSLKMLDQVKGNPKDYDMILHFRIATEGAICPGNCHPFPLTTSPKGLKALRLQTSVAVAHNGILVGLSNTERLTRNNAIPYNVRLTFENGRRGYVDKRGQFTSYEWTEDDWAYIYNEGTIRGQDNFMGEGCYVGYCRYRGGLDLKFSDTQVFVRDYLAPCRDFVMNRGFLEFMAKFVHSKFAFLGDKEPLWCLGDFKEDKGRSYSNESYKTPKVTTHVQTINTKQDDKKDEQDKQDKKTYNNYGLDKSIKCVAFLIRCGLCHKMVNKMETHPHEETLLCDACYKALPEPNGAQGGS